MPKSRSWHQRASRAEISEIASIDKLIADQLSQLHPVE
jgi:hypothetical protein